LKTAVQRRIVRHGPERWHLDPDPRMPLAVKATVAAIVMLLAAGAVWLAIERAPAMLLDLAKMPWCG